MTMQSQAQPEPEKFSPEATNSNFSNHVEADTTANNNGQQAPGNNRPVSQSSSQNNGQSEASLEIPRYYRGTLDGSNAFPDDPLLDAAVLHYEYDRRRRSWWEARRWFIYGFAVLAPLFLLIGIIGIITKNGAAGFLLMGAAVCFVLLLLTLLYSRWTLPKIISFGRVYRRFVSVPLERHGLVWNDPVVTPPDFPALRDNFFALYRDSDELGSKMQPDDDEETTRKKRTLNELSRLIAPLKSAASAPSSTPYIPREYTAALDKFWLQAIGPQELADISAHTIPVPPQADQLSKLEQLAHEVEDYSGLDELKSSVDNNTTSATIHTQIASKVEQNLEMVSSEMQRWQERAEREKAFNQGLIGRYDQAYGTLQENFGKVEAALEAEIRPAVQRLEAETAFYRSQVQRFYGGQTDLLENARDTALSKLDRQRQELTGNREERLDEQGLLQAELKRLNDQRARLDNSTNSRFEGLKSQLVDLTDRSYNLPPTPHFRSDIPMSSAADDSETVLRMLTQLRADARLATSDVNEALNRYARLRFEPLDELGRLRQQIAAGTKWQATAWLGNLINFRHSGQLLALAGEVGDAVSVYLDYTSDFERLNGQWCALETSLRELGLTAYANQLADGQRHLEGLEAALTSLQSSLAMAPHSPEMARPSTFQNLYDLAAGLQRELDELGGLAGSIARTQERLSELDAELAQLEQLIAENQHETESVHYDATNKLSEVQRKQTLLLTKLDELKTARLQKMRAHIIAFTQTRDAELAKLDSGSNALHELNEVSEKFLQKHLRLSRSLLDQANSLRQGLETTISAIVQEFERSVHPDRSLRGASELFVPAWYFQLVERPVWRKKTIGFACCYSSITRPEPINDSFWRFVLTNKPAAFFKVEQDEDLEKLVQVDNMEYPAGEVQIPTTAPDWLVSNYWVSSWLLKLYHPKK